MRHTKLNRVLAVLVSVNLVLGLVPLDAWAYEADALGQAVAGAVNGVAQRKGTIATGSVSGGTHENATDAPSAFVRSKAVGDAVVMLRAVAGTFPEEAMLVVRELPPERRVTASQAVDEARLGAYEPAASYAYDVLVVDEDGSTLTPAEGGDAELSVELPEAADAGLEPHVWQLAEAAAQEGADDDHSDAAATLGGAVGLSVQGDANLVSDSDRDSFPGAGAPVAGGLALTATPLEARADTGAVTVQVSMPACLVVEYAASEVPDVEAAAPGDAVAAMGVAMPPAGDPATSETAFEGASTTTEVTATSATDNVVGEVFANAANAALARGEGLGTAADGETLEAYPTESHPESYYDGSPRLRTLTSSDGADMGFVVYRESPRPLRAQGQVAREGSLPHAGRHQGLWPEHAAR